ncbi:unnamed protein product [Brassica rapa subsp. trilocularis]|uniref:(rape) hypothetical protein n=1 Tax=Brassica napus TaxID=3708 RepID=A0A816V581_BRANA|nr:unnamed protein product [Brassica napus]
MSNQNRNRRRNLGQRRGFSLILGQPEAISQNYKIKANRKAPTQIGLNCQVARRAVCKPTPPSPLYPPVMEAPPPPYPPTSTRFQDYYSGYGQPHPPPLRPYRDEYYGEGEYMGCFPFLRTCLTTLCCCWFVERCCLPSRY